MGTLSVKENFSAALRLPSSVTPEEREQTDDDQSIPRTAIAILLHGIKTDQIWLTYR